MVVIPERRPDVELRLPADGAYVSVLRTTTAGIAARLDFLIDDIEDLRIAVGEACAMVLPLAAPGGDVTASYLLAAESLTVTVAVEAEMPGPPDYDSFAWQVLSTLAAEATAESSTDRFAVNLTVRRDTGPEPAETAD
jgi:serine/threonine-protein kinase RsbW